MADENPRWVKIAPGPGARFWDDCLENGYIRVGWDAVRDLTSFQTRDDYKAAFEREYPGERASQLWTLMELRPGDRVVANRGESHILGVGRVTDAGYRFLESRDEFKHSVAVEWDTSMERDIPTQRGWQPTVVNLTSEKLEELQLEAGIGGPPPRSWLFQSNPAFYDIDGAVAALTDQSWRIGQYASEIKAGDGVFLWRTGAQAAVIGVGTITSDPADMETAEAEIPFIRDASKFDGTFRRAMVRIDHRVVPPLLKSRIITDPVLSTLPNLKFANATNFRLSPAQASRLRELTGGVGDSSWDLEPGEAILRVELHRRYGGSRQGGISPSAQTPNVLVFTDPSVGQQHGYIYDGWTDDRESEFRYTGEGQQGDQTISGGNRAILEHQQTGRALRVFDGVRGTVRYIGEFVLGDPPFVMQDAPASGNGASRKVVVFSLKPVTALPGAFPSSFRLDLFDAAVSREKAAAAGRANAHHAASAELRKWLEMRHELTDEEFWQGMRDRFLPFGEATIDGQVLGATGAASVSQEEFDAAFAAGQVEIRGNQQWTSLARSAGRAATRLPALRTAVDLMLDDQKPYRERIGEVMSEPARVPGWGMAHWTALDAMTNGWQHPVLNSTVRDAFDRLGWPLTEWGTPELTAELEARTDALLSRAGLSSLAELDRVYWHVLQIAPTVVAAEKKPTIAELNDELCLAPGYLADVEWLLKDKKQVVFYGPPGTGKTYVAERFAHWFAGDGANVEVIQFHPSYAYEDFVEGIRPALDVDDLTYRLVPGLLREFAARSLDDPDVPYVLLIDEINRANLARVFGELLYLLEYREKYVTLPYSQEGFRLPDNLYIIGTMNTADRSIALVDFALRRRFHFLHFAADPQILRRWLNRYVPKMGVVADYLQFVNDRLGQSDFAVGFSYFMRGDLNEEILRRLWERSVLPALAEYYFNDPEQLSAFNLDAVRTALAKKEAEAAAEILVVSDELPASTADDEPA